ncbi:glutamate receptor ionotropic, kainate 2-like [Dermacentor variabilis]|uniref:glutamate receptor ionotropic, kainate 2-like n=1 Tax=Dermacentor variabilis TaxID=34621 RepID=UPI003F5AF5A9
MYGPMANMIEVLSQEAGFTYNMVCPDEGGTGIALPNGTWIGLVGDLYRNRADIVITPISVTYDRTQVVNFSPQIMAEYLAILAGFPDLVEISAFGTLMAFHWQVWAGLLCSLAVCVISAVLLDARVRAKQGSNIRLGRLLEENWWLYVSAMFMESSMRMPQDSPGRMILASWWLIVVVLMNAFTGHMKATMMLFPEPERIDSFKDLARRTNIRPFLWKGGAYENLLKKSLDVEEYRKVWNLIVTHDGLREDKYLYDEENLREVLQGKAVIVSDYTTTLYQASQTCRRRLAAGSYYFAKEPTFSTKLSMAVSRSVNPALMQLMNERANRLVESGVIKAWMETQLGDWRSCLLAKREETYSPLSLFEVQSVFLVFLIFAGFSVAFFIAEILVGGSKNAAPKRRRMPNVIPVTSSSSTINYPARIRGIQMRALQTNVAKWKRAH